MEHGGGLDQARALYGGEISDWLDLSTGINPNPYPDTQVPSDSWSRLPDEDMRRRLLEAARGYYGVPGHAGIVTFNGTQAVIQLLPNLTGAAHVALLSPTYNEYAHVFGAAGIAVSPFDGRQLPDMADGAVIVNPNNPDGRIFEPHAVTALANALASRGGRLIVDEAFMDCRPEFSIIPELPDNAFVLRSFGKFFGLAGLRLGFLVGPKAVCEDAARQSGPWCVSGPALAIGERALNNRSWIAETRKMLAAGQRQLFEVLEQAGLAVAGSTPLFVYVRHPHAHHVHEELAKRHILVRCFRSVPDALRFGICPDAASLERLSKALDEALRMQQA